MKWGMVLAGASAEIVPVSLEIGRFLFSPGRKFHGFLVEARAERGVFRRMLEVAAKHNARLRLAHFQSFKRKTILVFFDCTECDVEPQELMKEISRSRNIISIKPIESKIEGFIIDTATKHLTISGVRSAAVSLPVFRGLIQGVHERLGSGGAVFLYYMGVEAGREASKLAREMALDLGILDSLRILRDITLPLYGSTGWGFPEVVEYHDKSLLMCMRIYDSLECEVGRGARQSYSHLARGFIAGCIEELFGVKVSVIEVKCIAKNDPYCEFTVKPA